jgi:hypothetical protein
VAFNAGAEIQLAKPLDPLKQIAPSATRVAVIYSAATSQTVSGAAFTYPNMAAAISGMPRKFELAVNLKTAKAIGLAVPRSILLSADKVIA